MKRIGSALGGGPAPGDIVDRVKVAEALRYESAWMLEGRGGRLLDPRGDMAGISLLRPAASRLRSHHEMSYDDGYPGYPRRGRAAQRFQRVRMTLYWASRVS
jgi:hypothetical protein